MDHRNERIPMPEPSIQNNSGYNSPQGYSQPTSTYSIDVPTSQPSSHFVSQSPSQMGSQPASQLNMATIEQGMQNMRVFPDLKETYGPYCKFNGIMNNIWYGSVMVVSKQRQQLSLIDGQSISVQPFEFHSYQQYHFYRFSFTLNLSQNARKVGYQLNEKVYYISLPAINEPIRALWHSCNGFSSGVDETVFPFDALWIHVLNQHNSRPYHCQMGGGDQLYCDSVFDQVPSLVEWVKIPSKKKRETTAWTAIMQQQVDDWYFQRYVNHFDRSSLNTAIAEIPYAFNADDHDLFDGFGSYPDRLQNCPVFQGVFAIAYHYYLLFQQQSTSALIKQEGYFGDQGNSFIRHMGDKQACLMVDTRKERSLDQVVSPQSYRAIYDALDLLPVTLEHLFVLLPVPIVYPRLKATEKGLSLLSSAINSYGPVRHVTKQLQIKGIFKAVISKFGEPELLDDLCDHWTAHEHKSERKILVENLQALAIKKRIRITFVSGDVHCCGSGRFWHSGERENDPCDMTQVITSAIVNAPPPDAVIRTLHLNERKHHLNTRTKEEMYELFATDVDGKSLSSKKLMRRRNFAKTELMENGSVVAELHVEQVNVKDTPHVYPITIPRLNK